MTAVEPLKVRVTHRFDAAAERVFDAWLDQRMLSRWMFGPGVRDEEIVHLELEPCVGGSFSFLVLRQGQEIDHVGEYLEIERPHRLAFTWGIRGMGSSRVQIEIVPQAGACTLTLTHELDPQWAAHASRTQAGWTHMLDALTRRLGRDDALGPPGVVTAPGTLRIERLFPGTAERLWAYLTDPDKRGLWLAAGPMELRVGGTVELRFDHAALTPHIETPPLKYRQYESCTTLRGTVTCCNPPHKLSYTWGEGPQASEVSFELMPQAGQVLLVLTHRKLAGADPMASVASGWHTHLAILGAKLAARIPPPFWATHTELEAEYRAGLPE